MIPRVVLRILMPLSVAFTRPTFQRVLMLFLGAVLLRGKRSVTAALGVLGKLAQGHFSSYHRVFSRARWSLFAPARVLAALVIALAEEHNPTKWIAVVGDDTVLQAKGKKVYGKARHHDAVRSTHRLTVWRWGHRWVVLAIVVFFPWTTRGWALPVLVALYRSQELNESEGRRHKTPIELAQGLFALLLRWFPDKKFVFLGDGAYASHQFARFFDRHRRRAALVARFYGDAALYEAPPKYRGVGRPRVKGEKLPTPCQYVAGARLKKVTVPWYGGGKRRVALATACGHWYRAGQGLVPLRWVFVRDLSGQRREEFFFTTATSFSAKRIIYLYTLRWSIETTFQELRAHLGLETTRGWCRQTVLRMAPCLFALFTIVSLIYHQLHQRGQARLYHRPGYHKSQPTFADAIATVRRACWQEILFSQPRNRQAVKKLPRRFRQLLLDALCQPL